MLLPLSAMRRSGAVSLRVAGHCNRCLLPEHLSKERREEVAIVVLALHDSMFVYALSIELTYGINVSSHRLSKVAFVGERC